VHGFEEQIDSVLNGGGRLLERLGGLEPGECGVADVDFSRHGVNAWVVGVDEAGNSWESRVELDRDVDGRWVVGASSTSSWEGWTAVTEPASDPGPTVPGTVFGLVLESGRESPPNRSFTAVRGVASADVAAIEVSVGKTVRRRPLDSPSGAFIVTIPVFDHDGSVRVRAIGKDGASLGVS
jgi:hypothetical protein